MRVFVGIPLPSELQLTLVEQTRQLRKERPEYRWVRTENMHITVVFLGELGPDAVETLAGGLRQVGASLGPFRIAIDQIGQFPLKGRARVVFASIAEGEQQCREVHRAVSEVTRVYVAADRRPYAPHITLARVKPHHPVFPEHSPGEPLTGSCSIEGITLFESRLGASGATYYPVAEIPLSHA